MRTLLIFLLFVASGCSLQSSTPAIPSATKDVRAPFTPWRAIPGPALVWNSSVQKRFDTYLRQNREDLRGAVERMSSYLPEILPIFEKYALPPELLYLGILESWFKPEARSPAGAVGIWQIMKPLASEYGLRVGIFVDERKDVVKSTEAVARILLDLYREFDDWFLALAAYNAGKYKVAKVVRETELTDFWSIAASGKLRTETEVFVPKFIALALILQEGERYGITRPW